MNYSRDSIRKNKIKLILTEDHGLICQYCGCDLPVEQSTLDHIVATNKGGSNHISNLIYCCKPCNSSKGTKSVEEFRLFRSIQESEYDGILCPRKYTELMEIGALKRKVSLIKFEFEAGSEL
ncbi:hypothetical protein [Vibrio phage 2E1]|nr:hypothetical protein [Vibrio phage 2E1]